MRRSRGDTLSVKFVGVVKLCGGVTEYHENIIPFLILTDSHIFYLKCEFENPGSP